MQNKDFLGVKVTPTAFVTNLLKFCSDNRRPLVCNFPQPPSSGQWKASKITKSVFRRISTPGKENRYITISTFQSDRRRISDFVEMVAVMIDDPGTKVPLDKIVLPPSYWLETSPGNFQAWYFLSEPEKDPAKAEAVLNALVASGLSKDGKDPGMKGLTRYGRLPGGWNNKESLDTPHRVTAYKDKSGFNRYSIDQIIDAYDLELKINDCYSFSSHAIDEFDKLTALQDPVALMFEELGLVKYKRGNKLECTCPWVEDHTDGVDNGTALLIQPGGEIGFKCFHGSHIDTKTLKDVHKWLKEEHSDLYREHYPDTNEEEIEDDPEKPSIEEVILSLFKSGLSPRDVSLKSREFGKEYGVSSHEFNNFIRIIYEEFCETESLESVDVDTLSEDSNRKLEVYKAFPKSLADAILSKADSDRLDPARPVQSLIPCIASQLGSKVKILTKPGVNEKESWYEYPFISCIDIGNPSEGKSQTNRTITAPLVELQSEMFDDYRKEKELYEEASAIAKRTGDVMGIEPPARPPKLYVTGGTAEGIMKRISELPPRQGMLYICDEIAGLLVGADQYKQKSNFKNTLLTALMSPLKGTEERSNSESGELMFNNQTLSISGSIQLSRVIHLFDPKSDESGFGSRFLCSHPDLPSNFSVWSETQVNIFDELNGLIRYLRDIKADDEIVCTMDEFTYRKYVKQWEYFRRIQEKNKDNNPGLSSFIGKCPGHLSRLILVSHCIGCFYGEETLGDVTLISFRRGLHLMNYFISQFRLLQIKVAGPDDLSKAQYYLLKRLRKAGVLTIKQVYIGLRSSKELKDQKNISMKQVRSLVDNLEKHVNYDKLSDTITMK